MSLDLKSYLSNNGFYENNSDIRKVPVGAVMALIWNIYDIHPLIMEFAKKYNE
jgi:hypothetical protein